MAAPIMVECRCGWRGYSDKLATHREDPTDKHCPLCDAIFLQWPKRPDDPKED